MPLDTKLKMALEAYKEADETMTAIAKNVAGALEPIVDDMFRMSDSAGLEDIYESLPNCGTKMLVHERLIKLREFREAFN